jgi:stage II sporulation protein D
MLIRRATASLAAVALLPALAAVVPAQAAPDRRAPSTVTFTTIGNGHGKGLSQYGARNRAAAGQGWKTIVRHYYPRTSWGSARGLIRVQISEDTSKDVVVRARPGLKVHSLGGRKTWRLPAKVRGARVGSWKILPAGHSSKVLYRTRGWHPWRTAKGDAEFTAGGAPIVLLKPGGRASYRGALRSASVNASGSSRDTVNVLPLDTYLRGVIADEVPASWPANAVRAQAVAARTYAAFERRDSRSQPFDLCDTANCQVYGGVSAEHPLSDAAIRATARRIVTFGGKPAFAQFTASNGGWSVDGGYPYLRAREDTFDHGIAGDPTTMRFSAAQVAGVWPGIGDLVSIKVTERDGHGPFGGRATRIRVVGTDSSVTATGDQVKSWFGLQETLMRITAS